MFLSNVPSVTLKEIHMLVSYLMYMCAQTCVDPLACHCVHRNKDKEAGETSLL